MTKAEFKECFEIAKDLDRDLSGFDERILYGCGLRDFRPVTVQKEVVAKMLRWQALCFDGSWDQREIDNCYTICCLNRRIQVV